MPQKFVNLENLTSFWGNAKEYIGNERKEIEDQLYNWQKTEKAPVVQCEPVPNSELHPIVEFKFKETLPEGEKGLDNPSTIIGVNSVTVTRTNSNLIRQPYYHSSGRAHNGITWTVSADGSISASGTSTSSASIFNLQQTDQFLTQAMLIPRGSYHFSGCPAGGSGSTYRLDVAIYTPHASRATKTADYGNGGTLVVTEPALCSFYCLINANQVVSNLQFKPTLQLDGIDNSFEKSEQDVCTISLDSTYYGGSIDLFTGLMTVTWISETISSLREFTSVSSDYVRFRFSNAYYSPNIANVVSFASNAFEVAISDDWYEHIRPNAQGAVSCGITILKSRLDLSEAVDPSNPTDAEWLAAGNAYFSSHPFQFVHKIVSTQVIQLTPQQIKSLPSLEGTSKRVNTIYTDADSVQVEYQKYVGIDSTLDSNSVNAIQNKVVNSALNTKVSLTGDETISGTKTFSNTINGSITGDAGTVAGHIVSKDVPVNAVFTDTTYDPATQSTAGLMSASDKTKLDAVGSVFTFKGSVIDDTYLPASDNANGDAYLAEDTGHVHVYDGTSFVDIGIWTGIPSATDAQIDALFED